MTGEDDEHELRAIKTVEIEVAEIGVVPKNDVQAR